MERLMLRQITSVQHPLVKHLVKLRLNRDYRYEHQSLLLEGITMVTEMRSKKKYKVIATVDEMLIPLGVEADEVILVNESVMNKISGVQSPEGIIAEIAMPESASLKGKRLLIAIDGVSDPGNLGTLLRSALALGWDGAFIVEGSCDPYNEKALRSARGATFRLPLAWGNWADLEKLIQENQLKPYVADLSGCPLSKMPKSDKILLVLSNEARGVSPAAKKVCKPITIEMPGDMESLNVSVAGSIMMYSITRELQN